MKPDWIIHYILDAWPSSHTHGLSRYGGLELELNLPVSQEKAMMILNLLGMEIAEKESIIVPVTAKAMFFCFRSTFLRRPLQSQMLILTECCECCFVILMENTPGNRTAHPAMQSN